jgi:hypothetical protein
MIVRRNIINKAATAGGFHGNRPHSSGHCAKALICNPYSVTAKAVTGIEPLPIQYLSDKNQVQAPYRNIPGIRPIRANWPLWTLTIDEIVKSFSGHV